MIFLPLLLSKQDVLKLNGNHHPLVIQLEIGTNPLRCQKSLMGHISKLNLPNRLSFFQICIDYYEPKEEEKCHLLHVLELIDVFLS